MHKGLSMLSIGSELLDGRVIDTNSNSIAHLLQPYGIQLKQILSCTDDINQITSALNYLSTFSSAIIVSGGLGPTSDDLTREALSQFSSDSLEQDQEILKELQELYLKRKRVFDPANLKQTFFPSKARIIKNPSGTAAGFYLKTADGPTIFALPGVPSELRIMFEQSVLPRLLEILQLSKTPALKSKSMRIFGLPESIVGSKIEALKLDSSISVSYRAHFPEIELQLKSSGDAKLLQDAAKRCEEALEKQYIFSEEPQLCMHDAVHHLLLEKKFTLGLAESCTAGMIAAQLAHNSGASNYLLGAVVSYSNKAKIDLLGVKEKTLAEHGAVSRETALQMAEAARKKFNADLGISVTGIAGPQGGSEQKPVGTFFLALSCKEQSFSLHYFFASSRSRIREYATWSALDMLRRYLLNLPQRPEFQAVKTHAG